MLLYLHVAAFLIHTVSCILSINFHISNSDVQVLRPLHIFKQNQPVHTTTEHLTDINPISIISWNEGLTAFSHAIAIYYLYFLDLGYGKKRIERTNSLELNRRTWEYCVTAFLLQVALVAHVGDIFIQDIVFLLIINVVIQLLGVSIDMTRQLSGDIEYGVFWYFVMAFMLLLAEIIYVLEHCLNIEYPHDATLFYVSGTIYGVLYVSFGLVKLWITDETKANEVYVALSVTTKVVLSWIIIANSHYGFSQLFDSDKMPSDVVEADWESIVFVGSTILILSSMALTYIIVNRDEKDEDSAADLKELCIRDDLKLL